MPAARAAANKSNVSNIQPVAALAAFPSPASVHDSLSSPPLSQVEFRVSTSQSLSAIHDPLDAADTVPAQPGDVQISPAVTPFADDMPGPDMNLVVGGALAPVRSTQPSRSTRRRLRPGLRLPSFQSLGIANPNPDRFGFDGNLSQLAVEAMRQSGSSHQDAAFTPVFPDLKYGQILQDAVPDVDGKLSGGRAIQSPVSQLVNTLTPPAEPEHIEWTAFPTFMAAIDSPSTDTTLLAEEPQQASAVGAAAAMSSQSFLQQSEIDQRPPWIRGSIDVLGGSLGVFPKARC